MEKKTIIKEIGESLEILTDYDCGDSPFEIDEVIRFLNKAKHRGANQIKVAGEIDYDGTCLESIAIQPVIVSLESDEEYESRIVEELKKKRNIEEAKVEEEMKVLAALKKKYE